MIMTAFDAPYWNLGQAAAWVMYRERELVERFSIPDEVAFAAIGLYPTMWPAGRAQTAQLSELHNALLVGRLVSKGYHTDHLSRLATIPPEHWEDLYLRPPSAYDQRYPGRKYEPWTRVRVASADVRKLWRGPLETSGRTKFDWPAIRELSDAIRTKLPDISQNELIVELQGSYEEKSKKKPPSRSAIQNHLKQWK